MNVFDICSASHIFSLNIKRDMLVQKLKVKKKGFSFVFLCQLTLIINSLISLNRENNYFLLFGI